MQLLLSNQQGPRLALDSVESSLAFEVVALVSVTQRYPSSPAPLN